ncbi:MAG: hypothetical protein AB7F96_10200 [Beijerinckiaceae bacterium]
MSTHLRTSALAVLALAAATGAALPAHALGFRNCTGEVIRVNVYNNDDALRVVPKAGGAIGPGDFRNYNVGGGLQFVKIFRAQVGDRLMRQQGGISGGGNYSVQPGYRIGPNTSCAATGKPGTGPGPGPQPFTLGGSWIPESGVAQWQMTISQASPGLLGVQVPAVPALSGTYRRFSGNSYRGPSGATISAGGPGSLVLTTQWGAMRYRRR